MKKTTGYILTSIFNFIAAFCFLLSAVFQKQALPKYPFDPCPNLAVGITGRHEFCAHKGHPFDFEFVFHFALPSNSPAYRASLVVSFSERSSSTVTPK